MKLAALVTATALFATSATCAAVRPEVTAAPAVKRIHRPRPAKALLNVAAGKRDDDDDDGSYDDDSGRDGRWSDGPSTYTYRSNGRVYTVTMNDGSGSGSGNRNYLTDDLLDMLPDATDRDTLASLSRIYQSITADPSLSPWVNQPSVSREIASASRAANDELGRIRNGGDRNPFDQRSGAGLRVAPAGGIAFAMAAAGAAAAFALL
ncbi:hypothetical protein OC835_001938 [Tilletia horrida]|nr:hypothetical protein OC835_001938 [Tilletia horrida]